MNNFRVSSKKHLNEQSSTYTTHLYWFFLGSYFIYSYCVDFSFTVSWITCQSARGRTPTHTPSHTLSQRNIPKFYRSSEDNDLSNGPTVNKWKLRKHRSLLTTRRIGHPLVGRLFQTNRLGRKCIMWNWARKYHTFPHALSF